MLSGYGPSRRRQRLLAALLLIVVLAGGGARGGLVQAAPGASEEIWSASWTILDSQTIFEGERVDLETAPDGSGLTLAAGADRGRLESLIHDVGRAFTGVGLLWQVEADREALTPELRTSADGVAWTPWQVLWRCEPPPQRAGAGRGTLRAGAGDSESGRGVTSHFAVAQVGGHRCPIGAAGAASRVPFIGGRSCGHQPRRLGSQRVLHEVGP